MVELEPFISPAPIPVARFPELAELEPYDQPFGTVSGSRYKLHELHDLRHYFRNPIAEAAISMGRTMIMPNLLTPNDVVTMRSGYYSPNRPDNNIGFHYDLAHGRYLPASFFMLSTHLAGKAAAGEVGFLPLPSSTDEANQHSLQAAESANMGTILDLSLAKEIDLEPCVLYFFPRQSVHSAPEIEGVRNLFRFKNPEVQST